eukprot:5681361-Prymnesium_polylepis.1
MTGLQKSHGQRCPQTSPCRSASLPKNGGFHSSVPCTTSRHVQASSQTIRAGRARRARRARRHRP